MLGIKLKRIRIREQKKLNEKNLWLFKNIIEYIKGSSLTIEEEEEVLNQIMDMMLEAQAENKSVDLFMGNDYEVFCRSIIDEYNNSKSSLYRFLNLIQRFLIIFTVIIAFVSLQSYFDQGIYGFKLDQILIAIEISILMILISRLKTHGKLGFTAAYLPFYKRIKYNYLNQKDISAPIVGFIIFAPFINIMLQRLVGDAVFNYQINFYSNMLYFIAIILCAALIQIYKISYNNK